MKRSMIVMMMIVMMFSLNLFGEDGVVKEVKKECGADCTKPCCEDKVVVEDHKCTKKCELAAKHVCSDECKSENATETCELASLKTTCSTSMKDQGCKPVGCEQKIEKKGCHNK